MTYEIHRDAQGKPSTVTIDKGYLIEHRAFDAELDGWMEDQLDYRDFPMIRHGQDMEYLVSLVNKLKKENFELKRERDRYRKCAGL